MHIEKEQNLLLDCKNVAKSLTEQLNSEQFTEIQYYDFFVHFFWLTLKVNL